MRPFGPATAATRVDSEGFLAVPLPPLPREKRGKIKSEERISETRERGRELRLRAESFRRPRED